MRPTTRSTPTAAGRILAPLLLSLAVQGVTAQYPPYVRRDGQEGRIELPSNMRRDGEFADGHVELPSNMRRGNYTLGDRGDDKDQGQSSTSTELFLLSHTDFCLFGPADGPKKVSESEMKVVSWCSQEGHGTRLIPDGTLHGVTYVKAPNWVQVSGYGDFTNINIASGDEGGQFDSSEHTPEGAKMTVQGDKTANDWVTLISADTFCVRACTGDPKFCPAQYDEMGCFFLTSNGVGWDNVWQDCEGDDGDPPGIFDGKPYEQGDPVPSMVIPPVSACAPGSSISTGQTAAAKPPGSGSGNGTDSAGGETSWVPVQTCVPCTATEGGSQTAGAGSAEPTTKEGGEAAASSSPSAASGQSSRSAAASGPASGSVSGSGGGGGTEQVGVTKLSASASSSASASASAPTSPPAGSENADLVARWLRRDGETSTSDGQCCFTTWTPSVVGGPGAKETGKASGGRGNSSVSASGSGSGSGSASALLTGAKTAAATGTASSGNKTGNGTAHANGTGNGSSGAYKVEIRGLAGMGLGKLVWTVSVMGAGMMLGGVMMV